VFYQGAQEMILAWDIHSSYTVDYKIWRNGTYLKSGDIAVGHASVVLVNLKPGLYEFTIQIETPDNFFYHHYLTDSVMVQVLPSPIPIVIGSIGGIGIGCVVLVLAYKIKKS
ncbi:MAG: hypothetical protein P1Q69_21400, partial [Candidatus Thorarchaeota archaeon]|nr:hypothetical protein [Candidatus Thorarchaeota archaeon]